MLEIGGVQRIMLDNFSPSQLRDAVRKLMVGLSLKHQEELMKRLCVPMPKRELILFQ